MLTLSSLRPLSKHKGMAHVGVLVTIIMAYAGVRMVTAVPVGNTDTKPDISLHP